MAGHSKWANIKHRKAAQDAKRGKVFTRLIREITIAARLGGPQVADNPRLRAAVDKALGNNMTRDTIDRAIQRGAGAGDEQQLDEITYEGYGPGGVAILVEAMTDNRNRTVAEVRHAFSKHGGNLGTDGSVAYLFTKTGQITFAPGADEEKILEVALESGASDVISEEDGSIEVRTEPHDLLPIKDALLAAGCLPDSSEVVMLPAVQIDVEGEAGEKVARLLERLEDLDDIQNVFTNANLSEELLARLE